VLAALRETDPSSIAIDEDGQIYFCDHIVTASIASVGSRLKQRLASDHLLAGTALVLAGWTIATTLYCVYSLFVPIPFFDEWEYVSPAVIWRYLFEQHNEHRIVFQRFVILADFYFANGTELLSMFLTHLIQAANVALLVGPTAKLIQGWSLRLASTAIVATFLFSAGQYENFSSGGGAQFVGVCAFATAAFLCLTTISSWIGVIFAATAGLAASYTLANGLLVPLLLMVLSWWSGRRHSQTAALAAAAAITWAVYLNGYTYIAQDSSSVSMLITQPWKVVLYQLAFIGSPMASAIAIIAKAGDMVRYGLAVALGGAGVVILACILVRQFYFRLLSGPAAQVLLFVMIFVFLSGAMTALGRSALGFEQLFAASRYGTAVLIFWASVFLYAVLWAVQKQIPILCATMAALILSAAQPFYIAKAKSDWHFRAQAASAILANAFDSDALRQVYPDPERVLNQAAVLREQHSAIFGARWANWLGKRLDDYAQIDPADLCAGHLDQIRPAPITRGHPQAWRAHGWAWDAFRHGIPDAILITNGDNTIIGFGIPGEYRPDVRRNKPDIRSDYVGWIGHFVTDSRTEVSAYSLIVSEPSGHLRRPAACMLGRAIAEW
jgi:hypothetical protein